MRRAKIIVSLRLRTGVLVVSTLQVVDLERPGVVVVPDTDARLCVDPNTDSIDDGFGEGNSGTGESGARTASIDAIVKRDEETLAAGTTAVTGLARSSSQ
jgi:hypothetical protein